MTEVIIYDRGNDLRKMIAINFPQEHPLKTKDYSVDKFHFQKQKSVESATCCNPYEKELNGINTEVCEQINFWISRYKHITKHMNFEHFYFYIYITLNLYNEMKIKDDVRLLNKNN
jgi:hypothetical protein